MGKPTSAGVSFSNNRAEATDEGVVEGVDRGQSTFFPALLDDYGAEDNPARAADVFVDGSTPTSSALLASSHSILADLVIIPV